MILNLRKVILLVFILIFCSLSISGKEKDVNFAMGVEIRSLVMTGVTTEFNYKRGKIGAFVSYWHNYEREKSIAAEFFLALGLYKGDTYSFYIKGLLGKEAYLWSRYRAYGEHLGAGIKNEWNIANGKITFDIDFFLNSGYSEPNEIDDQITGLIGFKLGYLFYF